MEGVSERFRSEGMLFFFALMVPYCSLRLIALATARTWGRPHTWQSFRDGTPCRRGDFWTLERFEGVLGCVVMAAPVLLVSRKRMVQAGLLVLLVVATVAASVSICR